MNYPREILPGFHRPYAHDRCQVGRAGYFLDDPGLNWSSEQAPGIYSYYPADVWLIPLTPITGAWRRTTITPGVIRRAQVPTMRANCWRSAGGHRLQAIHLASWTRAGAFPAGVGTDATYSVTGNPCLGGMRVCTPGVRLLRGPVCGSRMGGCCPPISYNKREAVCFGCRLTSAGGLQ